MIEVSNMARIQNYVMRGKTVEEFFANTTEKFTKEEQAEIRKFWAAVEKDHKELPADAQPMVPSEWS